MDDKRFDFGDPKELMEAWIREQEKKVVRDAKNAERGKEGKHDRSL